MRLSSPPSRRLRREALLRDVRARLAERLPHIAQRGEDATDPAWILLEQAAWMVERLSEQLDQYPYAALRELFHVVGAEVLPALPALGMIVAAPAKPGELVRAREIPDTTRFFTPRTEAIGTLEFVPVEDKVPLTTAEIASFALLQGGELQVARCAREEGPLAQYEAWWAELRPTALFHEEEVRLNLVAAGRGLAQALRAAIKAIADRGIGWLTLDVTEEGEHVTLRVRVDPRGALRAQFTDHPGGDITVRWGALDGDDWCPVLRVSSSPALPSSIRGRVLSRVGTNANFLIRDVPPHFPAGELLDPPTGPIPQRALAAIWRTLTNQDTERLTGLKPLIQRVLSAATDPSEPVWAQSALANNLWDVLNERLPAVAHVRWPVQSVTGGALPDALFVRVSVVFAATSETELAVYLLDAKDRPDREPTRHTLAWTLPLPAPRAEDGWLRVHTLDVPIRPNSGGLLLACSHAPRAVMLNTILVAQAPAVRDGRLRTIQRQVPEVVSLLHEDLVSGAILARVGDGVLPPEAHQVLKRMPLARFDVEEDEPIRDLRGVGLDESAGRVTLHAPDAGGALRELRPGQRVRLSWYRRTDGAWGNVGPRVLSLVEQEPNIHPKILAISNPLTCWLGQDREAPEAAVERLFHVGGDLPVLPSDFERIVQRALGRRAPDWTVRCWTYLERTLFPWTLWPLAGDDAQGPERLALRKTLEAAGPEQLVIAMGPTQQDLPDWDFEPIRMEVQRALAEQVRRIPRLRGCVITRLWSLRLEPSDTPDRPLDAPLYDLAALHGSLVDARGRAAPTPGALQLLNGVVTRAGREAP